MNCIDEKTLYELIDDELKEAVREEITQHLEQCKKCRETLNSLVESEKDMRQAWDEYRKTVCPSPEMLYEYEIGILGRKETKEIKTHLKSCHICELSLKAAAEVEEEIIKLEREHSREIFQKKTDELKTVVEGFIKERYPEVLSYFDAAWSVLKGVAVEHGIAGFGAGYSLSGVLGISGTDADVTGKLVPIVGSVLVTLEQVIELSEVTSKDDAAKMLKDNARKIGASKEIADALAKNLASEYA